VRKTRFTDVRDDCIAVFDLARGNTPFPWHLGNSRTSTAAAAGSFVDAFAMVLNRHSGLDRRLMFDSPKNSKSS